MTNQSSPLAVVRRPVTITKKEFRKIFDIRTFKVFREEYFNDPNLVAMGLPAWEKTRWRKKFNSIETKIIYEFFGITDEHFQE